MTDFIDRLEKLCKKMGERTVIKTGDRLELSDLVYDHLPVMMAALKVAEKELDFFDAQCRPSIPEDVRPDHINAYAQAKKDAGL